MSVVCVNEKTPATAPSSHLTNHCQLMTYLRFPCSKFNSLKASIIEMHSMPLHHIASNCLDPRLILMVDDRCSVLYRIVSSFKFKGAQPFWAKAAVYYF